MLQRVFKRTYRSGSRCMNVTLRPWSRKLSTTYSVIVCLTITV